MIREFFEDRLREFRLYTLHQRSLPAIARWQNESVRRLLLYSAQNVPFWQEEFASRGIDPASIRGTNDLQRLPVMRKEDFRRRAKEDYLDQSRPIYPAWHSTSGSTGKPFTFLSGNKAFDAKYDDFVRLRFLLWKSMFPRDLSQVKVARIKMSPETRPNRIFIPVATYREDPGTVIAQLTDFKPEVLESYATVILDLARTTRAMEQPLTIPYITSYGEMLTPAARSLIKEAFGAEVYDRYGVEEIGVLAIECEKHDGQHIYGESVVIEILDKDGQPLPSGSHGRVVVTDLLNHNMPFIRYETGDQGVISQDPCPCGLHMPRIWFDGRYSASLSFPRGNVHHLEFDGILNTLMHAIIQYQITKKSADRMEVRVIPGPSFDDATKTHLIERLHILVGDSISIDVVMVEEITSLPRGKSQTLRDESETEASY